MPPFAFGDEQYSQDFDQQRILPHTEPPIANLEIQRASTAASNAITEIEKDGDSGNGDQKERWRLEIFDGGRPRPKRTTLQEGDNTVQNEGIHIR